MCPWYCVGNLSRDLNEGELREAFAAFGDGRTEDRPIGMEGTPIVSPAGRFGLPVAAAGRATPKHARET